jgi:serine protease Do
MLHRIVVVLALTLCAGQASAQNEPFRIANRSGEAATALHIVRSGAADWGANILRGPLGSGAIFALRAPDGAGCNFDIRVVLQSGRDSVRRDVNVCQERTVAVAEEFGPVAAPPRAPR